MRNIYFTIGWSIWVIYFVVLETFALIDRDKGDTLSEHIWAIIFANDRPRSVVFYIAGGALVWLVVHFLFRGRFG